MNRRNWILSAAGLLVAPAVVRAESIMRVRPLVAAPVVTAFDLAWRGDASTVILQWRPVGDPEWRQEILRHDGRYGQPAGVSVKVVNEGGRVALRLAAGT